MNIIQSRLPDAEELFASLAKEIQPDIREDVALVGIRTGGVWLAERLYHDLAPTLPLGILDASFYRDDFNKIGLHHKVSPSNIPFEVTGNHIILVDDVLQTGRTIRAAVNELFDYGRPASIRLAVLLDRGERELPISAQYIGAKLTVSSEKRLCLALASDGKLSLNLYDKHLPE